MDDDKELAEKLMRNGLAMSESQAMEMATEINSTSAKAFPKDEEETTMETTDISRNKYVQDNIARMREKAMNSKPVDVRVDYEMPFNGRPNGKVTRTGIEPEMESAAEVEGQITELAEEQEEEEVSEAEATGTELFEIEETPATEESSPAQSRKDFSDMPEANVDLSDIFRFG